MTFCLSGAAKRFYMIQLGLENISISFGERQVLKNVSFSLNERERLGIVGVNGSGKSTLIKIISGQLTGFEGKLHMPKNTTLRVFDQNLALGPENTLFEEILLTYAPLIQLEERVRALNEAIEQGQIERVEEFTALARAADRRGWVGISEPVPRYSQKSRLYRERI